MTRQLFFPVHLREYCIRRLEHWINNAFVAKQMQHGREYIVENNAIYPVDYKSTGVIEINKKWGDGLQQFLEMKHGLPMSPVISDNKLFYRILLCSSGMAAIFLVYQAHWAMIGERKFMDDTFSVEFATIPTCKRRKLFELDGQILNEDYEWQNAVFNQSDQLLRTNVLSL